MFGGANTMVYTNVVQAILMIVVAIILIGSGYDFFHEGLSGFTSSLTKIDVNLTSNFNPTSPLFRDWFEVILCNFIVGVAIVCQPHIITKSLMLKSQNDINKYLTIAIITEILFFMVLFAGFYARLTFPDFTDGTKLLKLDAILSAYVVKKFSVGMGIIVILGLIAAGLSTLEGLVQSISTTITSDIIVPFVGLDENDKKLPLINKFVIIILAIITIYMSHHQLNHPNLSVGILAQNGVYAFFSAVFVPVVFGIYLQKTPAYAPMAASLVAIVVHFSIYYGSLTSYTSGAVRNPAVAAAIAILSALLVGGLLHFISLNKKELSKN